MTFAPQPKAPHSVNPHLRNLARNEACTGLLYGSYCHCDPATTVLAHTNTLSDRKGLGYKGHDHCGMLLGADCHSYLDARKASPAQLAAFVQAAQTRTRDRWAEIAADTTAKPWRRKAAMWALNELNISKGTRDE